MTRRRLARGRRVVVAFAVGCVVLFAASSASAPAASAPPPSIPIKGGGSWGSYREILTWQNDLSAAKQPIDLSYTAHGSLIGRSEFLSGTNDFVLSGVPFTADELSKVPSGAAGIIDAPVQVSSLGFLLEAPVPDGLSTLQQLCNPDDPNVPDPSKCLVKKAYTGPVKIPTTNLAAMAMHYPGTAFPPVNSWNDPAVLKAMGVDNFTTPPLAGPAPVNRSDPDEVNFYLQQYVATHAPSVWAGLKAANPTIPWDPISERLGRPGASRDGVDQQSQQLALGGGDPTSGTINQFTAGVFAPVPPSALGGIKQTFPNVKLQFVEVQNANGDWVEPTPDSINAAVDAGGATPLYALQQQGAGRLPARVGRSPLRPRARPLDREDRGTGRGHPLPGHRGTVGRQAGRGGSVVRAARGPGAERGQPSRLFELHRQRPSRRGQHRPRTGPPQPARDEDHRTDGALRLGGLVGARCCDRHVWRHGDLRRGRNLERLVGRGVVEHRVNRGGRGDGVG